MLFETLCSGSGPFVSVSGRKGAAKWAPHLRGPFEDSQLPSSRPEVVAERPGRDSCPGRDADLVGSAEVPDQTRASMTSLWMVSAV